MNISATTGNIKKANFGYFALRRKKRDKDMNNQKSPSNTHTLFFLKKSHGMARTREADSMLRTKGSGVDPLKNGRPNTEKRSTMVTECKVLTDLLLALKK